MADYPDDQPFASQLLFAQVNGRPLHVVAALSDTGETVIITVYQPDPILWNVNFTERLP